MFPSPQLKLERVVIGKAQDVRIDTALIAVSSLAILDERKDIDEVDVNTLTIDQEAVTRLGAWGQAPADARFQVQRIRIKTVKLALRAAEQIVKEK